MKDFQSEIKSQEVLSARSTKQSVDRQNIPSPSTGSNIKVFMRTRPFNKKETEIYK